MRAKVRTHRVEDCVSSKTRQEQAWGRN